jgi:peptide deformylase
MILDSVLFPNPLLKHPCHLVTLEMEGLQPFIDDMVETLYHHNRCVGLAANQVGKPWRIAVIDASRMDKPGSQHGRLILLNPFLVDKQDMHLSREGCLSVPDYTGNVMRASRVIVQAKDRMGNPLEIKAEGFEAIVLQHEVDHLDGALFLDRVASLKTDVFRRKKYL